MIRNNITSKTRAAIYKRDGYRCALCDSTRGLQIHHIMPRSQGGTNSPHNLITLCMYCHGVAHGTRFPEHACMLPVEVHEACIEYVADMYAPDWYPWEGGL